MTNPERGQPGPVGMPCHLCGTLSNRVCTDCGRFFCPQHGGERICVPPGSGMAFPTRVLCDRCAPDQEKMRAGKEFSQAFAVLVLGFGLVVAAVFAYLMWQYYSIPIPNVP